MKDQISVELSTGFSVTGMAQWAPFSSITLDRPNLQPIRQYIAGLMRGTLSIITLPTPADMARYSKLAYRSSPLQRDFAPITDGWTDNVGRPWWDAGGPGDTVSIVVTFNHPLITPLGLASYLPLQARRVAVNEAFRAPPRRATGRCRRGCRW